MRQSRPRKSETPNSLDPVERFYESPRNYDEAKDTHMTEVITRPSKGATKAPAANKAAPSPAPVSAQTNETTSPGASPSLRISAIVDTGFGVIVDGVSEPSWTRRGCAQARS